MNLKTFFYFTSPCIVAMFGLMALPLAITIYLGFHRFDFYGNLNWVGWNNYIDILGDGNFWDSLEFTLIFTFISMPAMLILGLAVALGIDSIKNKYARGFVISSSLLPFIVTPVVGTLVFAWLFRDFGFITYLLGELGIEVFWFANEVNARTLLILHNIWHVTPFAIVVFFAGLQSVPQDSLEAAIVDGANAWQRLLYVTIPHLYSLIMFVTIISLMDAYRIFDPIAVMTRGLHNTESLQFYNYRVAILQDSVAKGSAVAVITVIGIFVLLIPFLYLTYREQTTER